MQLVSNPKVNHPEPLPLRFVCIQDNSLWLKQVTDRYEYCSSHDKDLCKGTMSFVVYSTYLMPKQTSQPLYQLFLYSTCVLLPIVGCHKRLFLVNLCNSGDKWNCQNNKCSFAVIHVHAHNKLSYRLLPTNINVATCTQHRVTVLSSVQFTHFIMLICLKMNFIGNA